MILEIIPNQHKVPPSSHFMHFIKMKQTDDALTLSSLCNRWHQLHLETVQFNLSNQEQGVILFSSLTRVLSETMVGGRTYFFTAAYHKRVIKTFGFTLGSHITHLKSMVCKNGGSYSIKLAFCTSFMAFTCST